MKSIFFNPALLWTYRMTNITAIVLPHYVLLSGNFCKFYIPQLHVNLEVMAHQWHLSLLHLERDRVKSKMCYRVTSLINVLHFHSVWVRPDGEGTSSLRKALTILCSAFLNLIRCGNGANNVLRYVCFGKSVSYISMMWDFSADIWIKEVLLWILPTDWVVFKKINYK